jgi:hypothetical protein
MRATRHDLGLEIAVKDEDYAEATDDNHESGTG